MNGMNHSLIQPLTQHTDLSRSRDELAGLGLVGATHIHSSMVSVCVQDHEVGC